MSAVKAPYNVVSCLTAAALYQFHLDISFIPGFPGSDVHLYHRLIKPGRGDGRTAGPEVLASKIAASAPVPPGDLNGALVLEMARDVDDRIFGPDADPHMDVIRNQEDFDSRNSYAGLVRAALSPSSNVGYRTPFSFFISE